MLTTNFSKTTIRILLNFFHPYYDLRKKLTKRDKKMNHTSGHQISYVYLVRISFSDQ